MTSCELSLGQQRRAGNETTTSPSIIKYPHRCCCVVLACLGWLAFVVSDISVELLTSIRMISYDWVNPPSIDKGNVWVMMWLTKLKNRAYALRLSSMLSLDRRRTGNQINTLCHASSNLLDHQTIKPFNEYRQEHCRLQVIRRSILQCKRVQGEHPASLTFTTFN